MSWVRERSSNAAFDQSFAQVRDFEMAEPPAVSLPEANEPALPENEFHISSETQRPSRRNLMASMALGLVLGVFLPIALFLPLYRATQGSATELSSSDTGIHVSVSNDTTNLTVDTSAVAFAKEIRAEASPAIVEAPSNNAQFVTEQPVSLQPREYLAIRSAPRTYQPEILLESVDGRGKVAKVTADDLKILSGSNGRYRSPNSNAEWQGKWSFDNAEQNVKTGSAYADYLDKAFDSSFGNKLAAVNTKPTKFLSNITRDTAGPTGSKR